MKRSAALALMAGIAMSGFSASALSSTRVLLLRSSTATDPALIQQRQLLVCDAAGLAERQVEVIEWIGSTPKPAAAGAIDEPRTDRFSVILIGKDGGEKLRSTIPLPPDRVFATIDAMPMRQSEMHQSK